MLCGLDAPRLRRDGARAQLRWTRGELRSAIASTDTAIRDVAQLHETVAERDAHIEAIRVSTSWRITGPFRRVSRFLRKK